MKNSKIKTTIPKKINFSSKSIKVAELEERKEMLVIWRRGEGFFPDLRKK